MAQKNDDDVDVDDVVDVEDQADEASYSMGNIIVDDGSDDTAEEDQQILSNAPKSSKSAEEEEDEDVWVDDVDVFDDSDPFLSGEDYDPENEYYD